MNSVSASQPGMFDISLDSYDSGDNSGKTSNGSRVVPLEKPREINTDVLCQDKGAQPPFKKASLMQRLAYPLKANGLRLANDGLIGGIIAGGAFGGFGAGVGGTLGASVGACVAGLAKLAASGNTSIKKGAIWGGLVGAVIGGAITGTPGAVVGALAFAVCSLPIGLIRIPFDLVYAFRSASPEMPANLPKKLFTEVKESIQEFMDRIKLRKQMPLANALKELNLQVEGLDRQKLDKAFRQKSFYTHPDRCCGNPQATADFQRLNAARDVLLQALELETPLFRLLELQGGKT